MKTKTTKRSLLVSALVLLLCVSMLVGSTFAWFTDSVASTNNIIKSGSLDIELEYMDGNEWKPVGANTPLFSEESLWEPGHTEYVLLRVKNVGTLAVKYVLKTEIIEERQGINVYGDIFNLSDYLMYGVVTEDDVDGTREDAVAKAVTELTSSIDVSGALAEAGQGGALTGGTVTEGIGLLPGESAVAGIIITMPTTVGNEANYRAPATYAAGNEVNISDYAPYIKFGVNLYATQLMYEKDSFGNDYDKDAFVEGGSTSAVAKENEWTTFEVRGNVEGIANGRVATVDIHSDSVEDLTKPVTITVVPTDLYDGVTVEAEQLAKTYDISVTNLKADNTREISVDLQVGKGLSGVEVYHKGELIDSSYNSDTGIVRFKTYSFSPYTVVYDAEAEEEVGPENFPEGMPEAKVTYAPQYVNTELDWGSYGNQWSPTEGLDSVLEAAYIFKCLETADEAAANQYANWICDFYVKLDRDLAPNQIFLGGNYFDFGWIGFHNGDVTLKANEELPLLGSVTNSGWTYEDIATHVGTFTCGVGDVNNALKGATFTVMLRLTNPKDANEFYNVATINYTFE